MRYFLAALAVLALSYDPDAARANPAQYYDWSVILAPGETVSATCFGDDTATDFHAYRMGRPMRQTRVRTGWAWTFAGSDSSSARVVYSRRLQRARNVGPTRVRFSVYCES